MVTTFVFLNFCSAHWAKFDRFVTLSPPFVSLLHRSLTSLIFAMILISTLEAERCLALGTHQFYHFGIFSAHKTFATRFNAPTHQRIPFDFFFLFESLVLLHDLRHVFLEQPVKLFKGEHGATLVLQASDFVKFTPFNIQFELSLATFFAKAMLAREFKCDAPICDLFRLIYLDFVCITYWAIICFDLLLVATIVYI